MESPDPHVASIPHRNSRKRWTGWILAAVVAFVAGAVVFIKTPSSGPVGGDLRVGAGGEPRLEASHAVNGFVLGSPVVADDGALPVEFTGDGAGATLPLEWNGAPAETKSYALIMHHLDPRGATKWYWTLYNIPATVRALPKNARGIGIPGNNSVNHQAGYAPPHSKGPGPKTYVLTLYALSAPLQISKPSSGTTRDVLLAAMKNLILGSAELRVVYDRTEVIDKTKIRQLRDSGGS